MRIEKHAVLDVVHAARIHGRSLPPLFVCFPVVILLSGIEVLKPLSPNYT